jgi:3-oxoacyl-[acyl-carrier protein] reductase
LRRQPLVGIVARRLRGKVALVTGASGGIGSVTAVEFAKEGAKAVGIHYARSKKSAEEVLQEVKRFGGEGAVLKADVSDREQARAMVDSVVEQYGSLDVLVCFAGHPFRREEWFKVFEELTEEEFRRPLEVDLLGSVFCVQAAIPHMRDTARGRIILISSTPAISGDVVGVSYLLAKGGLLSLTRALAQYLGPHGIHVNALALGSIKTTPMAALKAKEMSEVKDETALKRLGYPMEVARKVVYLASDDSSFQTGSVMVVDGGAIMG